MVILRSIVSANKVLLMKLKVQFKNLSSVQLYTALLLSLEYTPNEIRIILRTTIKSIEETLVLIKDFK
jgi:hypothetical protein